MSVKRRPKKPDPQQSDQFIAAGPDAGATRPAATGQRRGRRRQITLTITDEMLAQLDHQAADAGISRAAAINLAIHQWLRDD